MTAPQEPQPEPLPIEVPHIVTRAHYERLLREASEQEKAHG